MLTLGITEQVNQQSIVSLQELRWIAFGSMPSHVQRYGHDRLIQFGTKQQHKQQFMRWVNESNKTDMQ
jgi:hypothetical protein